MKKVDFSIESSSSLRVPGRLLDIHNNFDFRNLKFSPSDDCLHLEWSKTNGDWLPKDEIDGFQLKFRGVRFLKTDGRFGEQHADNRHLLYCGYLHPEDVEVMDGCLDEEESKPDYHMIFVFTGGLSIKLYADVVSYIEEKPAP